jgi:transcriptional antiterminator NusG
VKRAIERHVNASDLSNFVKQVIIPTERLTEIKGGKRTVVEKKLFPGYIMIQMDMNEESWIAIRQIPGVGDFLGTTDPTPLPEHEAQKLLTSSSQAVEAAKPQVRVEFHKGDTVRVKEGPFENFEGQVEEISEQKGLVTVAMTIFGRPTKVELEYWQLERV